MLGEDSCQTAARFKKITDPIRPHQPFGLVPREHPIGALACADEAEETHLIGCQITAAWRVVADFPPGVQLQGLDAAREAGKGQPGVFGAKALREVVPYL
jgi:hypothetical protein